MRHARAACWLTIVGIAMILMGCKHPGRSDEIPWPEANERTPEPISTPSWASGETSSEKSLQPAPPAAPSPQATGGQEEPEQGAEKEAESGEQDTGPETIDLVPGDGKMKTVVFKHAMHQDLADCKDCHHQMDPGATPISCTDCHGAIDEAPSPKDAFHGRCKGCHAEMGAGPTKCTECHTK